MAISKEKARPSKRSLINPAKNRTLDNKETSSGRIRPENSSFQILNRAYHYLPKGHTYIGRGSMWGNPFVIGRDGTRDEVIEKYTNYFVSNLPLIFETFDLRVGAGTYSLQNPHRLLLVCYCAPNKCHGEVVAKVADLILEYCRRMDGRPHAAYSYEMDEEINSLFTKEVWDIVIRRCFPIYKEVYMSTHQEIPIVGL